VAKKLSDIQQEIDTSGLKFHKYLHDLLDENIMEKLESLTKLTEVYLFSGIIRNYFLKIYLKRDIDVVLGKEIDVEETFENLPVKRNSFGGYKILYPSGPLDLWFLKDTWAFQQGQKLLEFDLERRIPKTAFFNFSSIIFIINEKKFIYTMDFVKFLKSKTLDYVYIPNANYSLCILNTFYYSDKFNLKISQRLKILVLELSEGNDIEYHNAQLKHFGQILYGIEEIRKRLSIFRTELK